jgi:hypothetical protein
MKWFKLLLGCGLLVIAAGPIGAILAVILIVYLVSGMPQDSA